MTTSTSPNAAAIHLLQLDKGTLPIPLKTPIWAYLFVSVRVAIYQKSHDELADLEKKLAEVHALWKECG